MQGEKRIDIRFFRDPTERQCHKLNKISNHCIVTYREMLSQTSPCVNNQQIPLKENDLVGMSTVNVFSRLRNKHDE